MLRFGLGVAVAAAALDRLSKWLLLEFWDLPKGGLAVAPFFDLVMVWNRGVSFGLLNGDCTTRPFLELAYAWGRGMRLAFSISECTALALSLSIISLAIVAGLVVWLRRVSRRWLAAGLGLVIGGALSNVVDRLSYGAVADFFDFHLAGYHWPAFNAADATIVVGVAILLLDALFGGRESPKRRA